MSKELAPIVAGRDLITFDQEKLDLIRTTIASGLNENEFKLFMSVARARGLDPILHQIYAVKRDGKLVFQVGIDGGRLIAARTGEYAGSDRAEFERTEDGRIISAAVTVYRFVQGHRVGFTGIAYWDEFYPGAKLGFMWDKMPHSQLSKCAEMQALRKGFPNDVGGLYAPEELERDVSEPKAKPPGALGEPDDSWAKQINELMGKFRKIGISETQVCKKYGLDAAFELNQEQVDELNQIGLSIVNDKKNSVALKKEHFPEESTWASA